MATVYASYEAGTPAASLSATNTRWVCESFTTTISYLAASVQLYGIRVLTPGNLTLRLYAADDNHKPTGPVLATGTFDGDTLDDTDPAWFSVPLNAAYELESSTVYCIVSFCATGNATNYVSIYGDNTSGYSTGKRGESTDSGDTWATSDSHDINFRVVGTANINPPASDAFVTKRWWGIASSEFWYEDTAGNLVQLAASVGVLDTTDFIDAVGAYGKVFVVNGAIKQVVDFVNVKITTDGAIGTHPPDENTILTGTDSGAQMIVDYIDSLSGDDVTIYGRLIDSTKAFEAETVTGKDNDSNTISFTGTAQTTGPFWYDWTVFGNDASYGTMPAKPSLICLYRGRIVTSGNKVYPHQWYMTKVNRPFNFIYSATDPLTAVAGHNTTAGEIGDTVEALVPYGDSFLVFGCSSSVHVLDGDPAFSGSIEAKSDEIGFYGSKAWCKDAQYNLYFFGTNGIYKMAAGAGRPANMSEMHLPNLISDWALDKATKRVVMVYDSERDGILICNTTLASGVNLNYFYSFKTQGFYPETYPSTNAVFSAMIYDALNSTYSGLCLGCNDGYVRDFVTTARDDDVGATDTAISSYFTCPIFSLSEDTDYRGRATSITVEIAGGAAGGSFSDSDGCSVDFHVGNVAEEVLEDIKDGATPHHSETFTSVGRQNRIRNRMTGAFLGIKFYNSTAGETFAVNKIAVQAKPAGKIK